MVLLLCATAQVRCHVAVTLVLRTPLHDDSSSCLIESERHTYEGRISPRHWISLFGAILLLLLLLLLLFAQLTVQPLRHFSVVVQQRFALELEGRSQSALLHRESETGVIHITLQVQSFDVLIAQALARACVCVYVCA